jgi:hypothetical protein
MNPSEHEEEFFEAQIAVVATRLIVTGVLWCIALALIDRVGAPVNDPYVANTRLGLWLFLAEILVGTYSVRYTAPTSYPIVKRAGFVVAESCSQARRTAALVAINLILRWLIIAILTGSTIYLFGMGPLTRVAAIAPSLTFLVARVYDSFHIGNHSTAVPRVALIVLRMSLVRRLQRQGFHISELCDVQALVFPWGVDDLPASDLSPHYLRLGIMSGKTLCIPRMANANLRRFGTGEYCPILLGTEIRVQRAVAPNPELRCVARNIATDVRHRDDLVNLKQIRIPEEPKDNPFFQSAIRALVAEAIFGQRTQRDPRHASRRTERHRTPPKMIARLATKGPNTSEQQRMHQQRGESL